MPKMFFRYDKASIASLNAPKLNTKDHFGQR